MFSAVKDFFISWKNSKKLPYLFMGGLDAAGKTTLMWKFREYNTYSYPRYTVESAKALNVEICSFDPILFPGTTDPRSLAMREFVKEIIDKSDALIWMIDARDPERFDESKLEFDRIYQLKASTTVPILFLANKQDLPNVVPQEEIITRFNMKSLKNTWNIFPITATCADNVYEAFEWLLLELKDRGFAVLPDVQRTVKADCEVKPNGVNDVE